MIDHLEEGYDWDEEEKGIEEYCFICKKVIFNYPPSWDPICLDCWYKYAKKKLGFSRESCS